MAFLRMTRLQPQKNLLSLLFSCLVIVRFANADEKTFVGRLYPVPSALPTPKAFFPLTDGLGDEVASWPAQYVGTCNATVPKQDWWQADDVFGSVLTCSKNTSDFVELPSIPYATNGSFTVAFWVRAPAMSGDSFQYLYSHSAYGIGNPRDTFAPDSINVFLPEQQHAGYPFVRTVVKDGDDPDTMSILDSDGSYNDNSIRGLLGGAIAVSDGSWHFVTTTSRLDGQRGFLVYVDGSLKAQLPVPGSNNASAADGGGPMLLNGEIVLCSRDNLTDDRHFSGSLAHLSLFDAALTTQQVSQLYAAVPLNMTARSPSSVPVASTLTPSENAMLSSLPLGTSAWLNQFSNNSFLQVAAGNVVMCLTNVTGARCSPGYSCAPLSPYQISSLGSSFTNLPIGVCALPNGLKPPIDSLPITAGFFPLANFSGSAWPLPDRWFWNSSSRAGVAWVSDSVFGTVLDCNASNQESLSIGPFAWGTSGPFAFNLWVQQRQSNSSFRYLLSARDNADGPITNSTTDVYQPNEVHLYLPGAQHAANNLVRAIVKDNNDYYTGATDENFLDSDGLVGSNLPRDSPRLNLTDGTWHMITLTTQADGQKGFALYVDGLFMASEQPGQQTFFTVSGGDPMAVNGNLVLCGRSDLAADRFFDGRVTQLSVFNNALTSQAVYTLYNQVYMLPPNQSVAAAAHAGKAATAPSSTPSIFAGQADKDPTASTGWGLQRAPDSKTGGSAEDLTGNEGSGAAVSYGGATSETPGSSKHSAGAIAGIVIGSLAGAALLAALIALLISMARRRRRMSGVARLQEVPMPELGPSDSANSYKEDQFVITLNNKVLEAEQRRATAL